MVVHVHISRREQDIVHEQHGHGFEHARRRQHGRAHARREIHDVSRREHGEFGRRKLRGGVRRESHRRRRRERAEQRRRAQGHDFFRHLLARTLAREIIASTTQRRPVEQHAEDVVGDVGDVVRRQRSRRRRPRRRRERRRHGVFRHLVPILRVRSTQSRLERLHPRMLTRALERRRRRRRQSSALRPTHQTQRRHLVRAQCRMSGHAKREHGVSTRSKRR